MGQKELKIIDDVLIEGSENGRLFRVNCGMGWAGEISCHVIMGRTKKMIIDPRPFHGMPEGTADVIGWESKTLCNIVDISDFDIYDKNGNELCDRICPECPLSKKIAIFKAVEVKTGGKKLTTAQKRWRNKLIEHGGIYEERRE